MAREMHDPARITKRSLYGQAARGIRGTSNKYTPRDTEFVVMWNDARKMGARLCSITFSSRADAHWYAKGEPHTVKPINSLAAQVAR